MNTSILEFIFKACVNILNYSFYIGGIRVTLLGFILFEICGVIVFRAVFTLFNGE